MKVVSKEPVTFHLQQHASLHEIKLRRLLGRVTVNQVLRQTQLQNHVSLDLVRKNWVHPPWAHQSFHCLKDARNWVDQELSRHLRQV